jgi:hypothetical protein
MERPRVHPDRATVGTLHTIAIKTWDPPTGKDREKRLAELTAAAGGSTELLIEAAGILLGSRPPDPTDPRHTQRSAGAELLLEVAGVREDDPRVRAWVPVGAERRDRWRHPEAPTGWGPDVRA